MLSVPFPSATAGTARRERGGIATGDSDEVWAGDARATELFAVVMEGKRVIIGKNNRLCVESGISLPASSMILR
jgi:hypothetical protein